MQRSRSRLSIAALVRIARTPAFRPEQARPARSLTRLLIVVLRREGLRIQEAFVPSEKSRTTRISFCYRLLRLVLISDVG